MTYTDYAVAAFFVGVAEGLAQLGKLDANSVEVIDRCITTSLVNLHGDAVLNDNDYRLVEELWVELDAAIRIRRGE